MLCVLHAMIDQLPFRISGLHGDGRAECIYCEVADMLATEPRLLEGPAMTMTMAVIAAAAA
jgi:hypothetical protein